MTNINFRKLRQAGYLGNSVKAIGHMGNIWRKKEDWELIYDILSDGADFLAIYWPDDIAGSGNTLTWSPKSSFIGNANTFRWQSGTQHVENFPNGRQGLFFDGNGGLLADETFDPPDLSTMNIFLVAQHSGTYSPSATQHPINVSADNTITSTIRYTASGILVSARAAAGGAVASPSFPYTTTSPHVVSYSYKLASSLAFFEMKYNGLPVFYNGVGSSTSWANERCRIGRLPPNQTNYFFGLIGPIIIRFGDTVSNARQLAVNTILSAWSNVPLDNFDNYIGTGPGEIGIWYDLNDLSSWTSSGGLLTHLSNKGGHGDLYDIDTVIGNVHVESGRLYFSGAGNHYAQINKPISMHDFHLFFNQLWINDNNTSRIQHMMSAPDSLVIPGDSAILPINHLHQRANNTYNWRVTLPPVSGTYDVTIGSSNNIWRRYENMYNRTNRQFLRGYGSPTTWGQTVNTGTLSNATDGDDVLFNRFGSEVALENLSSIGNTMAVNREEGTTLALPSLNAYKCRIKQLEALGLII